MPSYQPKYPKAAECLAKDHESLLSFYDFPAEHWHHIRTSNPIESTFASVRLRTAKTRGCGSPTSILSMVFKLTMSAEQRWLKLRGAERIAEVIQGVKFTNGVREQSQKNGPRPAPRRLINQPYTTFDYCSLGIVSPPSASTKNRLRPVTTVTA